MFKNIFSSFIYNTLLRTDNKKIIEICNKELLNPSDHNQVDLPKNKKLKPLLDEIKLHVGVVAKHMGYGDKIKPLCTQAWINLHNAKEITKPHLHPKADLSCVYYPLADNNSNKIEFLNPCQQVQHIIKTDKIDSWNEYNSMTWTIEPSDNKLIIFPSWLLHYVVDKNNLKRISIAFNFTL
jgi:uncharacterized protein (TIGR02466 family)